MNLPLMLRFRAQSGLSFFLLFSRRLKKKKEVRRELRFALGERRRATDSEKKNLQSTHQTEERQRKEGENKPYDSNVAVVKKKIVRNNNLRERF
jgi:hypothetical protein